MIGPYLLDDIPNIFIIRIWRERRDGDLEWRGTVEHVPTHDRIYFQDTQKMIDFIIEKSGAYPMRHNLLLTAFYEFLMRFHLLRR